jgi:hypothetical protein
VSRRTRFVIELGCLQCGRDVGILKSDAWPSCGPFVLQRKAQPAVRITDWRVIRCAACGGSAIPGEVTTRPIYENVQVDWNTDKPRRGRPPKSVVDARRASTT